MTLFAIGDLHLSFSSEKPMDIYGGNWINHTEKIKQAWLQNIKEDDTVIIPGDTSWGLRFEEAVQDLEWIHRLPGKKVLIKGNHDLWWHSITRLNSLYSDMYFLQNNYFAYGDYAVCGTRGWVCPNSNDFTEHDEKIYNREAKRLKLSLDSAAADGFKRFIVALHYPPTNEKYEDSQFTQILEAYNVEKVVYGHLHGEAFRLGLKGVRNGVHYLLSSCDYLKCEPLCILP